MQNTNELHSEHQEWLTDLTLWHNELMFYDGVLIRLATQDLPEESTNKMEEFKSQFDNLQDKLGKMRGAIEEHEQKIKADGNDRLAADHNNMRDKIKGFEKEFKGIKNNFFVFADKED